MQVIREVLIHTPWWVYLILIYLISIGVKATRTRIVSFKMLFIMPSLFTYLSLYTLFKTLNVNLFNVGTWFSAILMGSALGWWQIYQHQLYIDRDHGLLQIPGTWSTLIIILLIFSAKYYFNYELAADPSLSGNTEFEFMVLSMSGGCTGLFIGRMLCFVYRFYTQASINLKNSAL